jgi:sortase A
MRLRALLVAGAIVVGGCAGDGRDSADPAPAPLATAASTIVPVAPAPAALAPTTNAPRPAVSALPDTTAVVSVAPVPTEVATATTSVDAVDTTAHTVPAPLPTLPAAPPAPTTTTTIAVSGGGGAGAGGVGNAGTLGRMEIPKLGISAGLQSGVELRTLDRGPGHWPGTARPGQSGNVVIAGHRTSHGGIFRNIHNLGAGDQIVFQNSNGRFVYVVTGTQIVNPDAMWIIGQGGGARATLFACHPPGSVAQRIVVFAELSA